MSRNVRLSDIAERLNLTKVSVSKALRDHPDISKETRALVKKTAAEMGYSPNLLARSLSSQRSHTLGVVVPKIAHSFFASIIEAIQEEASAAGYGILLAVSSENAEMERQHIDRLIAMRVDGLLVSASQQQPDLTAYERVRNMGIPLVFFDRRIEGLPFSSVTIDDYAGTYRAVEYMIRKGFRTFAHIAGTPDVEIGRARRAGFEAALHAHGLAVDASSIIEGGFDEAYGYRAFQELLRRDALPEVIVTVSFPVGLGVYGAIVEANPELLNRIELVSFGEGGLTEYYAFPHHCIRQPTREIGRRAAKLLMEHIDGGSMAEPQHIVVETELLTKESYAPHFQTPLPHSRIERRPG